MRAYERVAVWNGIHAVTLRSMKVLSVLARAECQTGADHSADSACAARCKTWSAAARHRQMVDSALELSRSSLTTISDVMAESKSAGGVAILAAVNSAESSPTGYGASALRQLPRPHRGFIDVRVGHVRRGLRTFDKWHPFPERSVCHQRYWRHFAPTACQTI